MVERQKICIPYKYNQEEIKRMLSNGEIEKVVDTIEMQIEELFLIRSPKYRYSKGFKNELKHFKEEITLKKSLKDYGNWFYFPNDKLIIHYLPEEIHQEIRTARNRNLITKNEQDKFHNFSVGIAGLSIGSHAAYTLSMMGGGKVLKLADPDTLSASNLNRVRYDFTQVGEKKTLLSAKGILKINPYADIYLYPKGINNANISEFLFGPPKIDVLIEEVDDLRLKFDLRFLAKEYKIPVIMATDNGDNVIVDVERYDLDNNLDIFNGLVGEITHESLNDIPEDVLNALIGNIVGVDYVTNRVLKSLVEVGKTLYSWPQLGDAANLSGSVIVYLIKAMSLGQPLKSGKYAVDLDKIFQLGDS